MRAARARRASDVVRDGVHIHYEVYGEAGSWIVFTPADAIVDSRVWKGQVHYLARRHQVVVIDPRGNGQSGRPVGSEHYADVTMVADLIAVMDEVGVASAVLVGLCESGWFGLLAAARHPDRVDAVVAIGPGANDGTPRIDRGIDMAASWVAAPDPLARGWELYNRERWRTDWQCWPRFFFDQLCTEPHSTKVYEDVVAWAEQTTGDVMVSLMEAESVGDRADLVAETLRSIRCPVLVIHGTHDRCQPLARGVHMARLAGAELLVLGGAGHLPAGRHPVRINHAVADFAARVATGEATRHDGEIRVRIAPSALKETTTRAREPDQTGVVERDGVRVAWQVYGEPARPDDPVVLLLPTWCILPAEIWKMQVPFLARRTRVVTFDPRGNGDSDRPQDQTAYAAAELTQDAVDVLDATGSERAVVVGLSRGNLGALDLAVGHPERVAAWIAIAPTMPGLGSLGDPADAFARWEEDTGDDEGWGRCNRHSWLRDYPGFVDFFFDQAVPEAHSTTLIEDLVGWSLGTDGTTLERAEVGLRHPHGSVAERCSEVSCPVVVVHGTDDRVTPHDHGARLAELTGGTLVTFEGSGHVPQCREPVAFNRVAADVLEAATGPRPPRSRERASRRPRRVLYLSSPIGLGHVRRDLAIVHELRVRCPDVEVEWLSQSPVTDFLEEVGERVHPASAWLASESGHIESEAGEHDLHAFQAIRRMDEILVANFMVFDDLVRERDFDLWIGDEAWELDHFLHENPSLKRTPFAWLTDFVGWMPLADGGDHEADLTSDYNAEMVEHVARHPRLRDRAVFVGDPEDLVDAPLGVGLPTIRDWTLDHFEFSGYVMGDRPDPADRARLRARLGYDEGEVACLVSVGGSGVGAPLLRRVIDAYDAAQQRVPGLTMHVVTGPRLDPSSFAAPAGVQVHGFLPDLDQHHAVCDVAIVQGGLSTTMELTANQRPFLYFPLRHHFEQQVHVRHRLDRHGAGRAMDYAAADPETIADALVEQLQVDTDYVPVPTDGAARAAQLLAELL